MNSITPVGIEAAASLPVSSSALVREAVGIGLLAGPSWPTLDAIVRGDALPPVEIPAYPNHTGYGFASGPVAVSDDWEEGEALRSDIEAAFAACRETRAGLQVTIEMIRDSLARFPESSRPS